MKENISKVVGLNIKNIRESHGLSLNKLSKLVEYSTPSTLYSLESGKGSISLEKLEKISEVLKVPINKLLLDPDANSDINKLADKEKLIILNRKIKKLSNEIMETTKEMEKILSEN